MSKCLVNCKINKIKNLFKILQKVNHQEFADHNELFGGSSTGLMPLRTLKICFDIGNHS